MRLWIDDMRPPPAGFTHHARNYDEAIALLSAETFEVVSFDHDLAEEHYLGDFSRAKSGYDIATWVEERARTGALAPFTWTVHSMNPAGARRIRAALDRAGHAWTRREE